MAAVISKVARGVGRVDETNSRTVDNNGRPKRNYQQSSSILRQAWSSIERIRFNISATVGAIENIERNLTKFEERRIRSTDVEKTVDELEPSSVPEASFEDGIEPSSDVRIEKGDFDSFREQGVEFAPGTDGGFVTEPEMVETENRKIVQEGEPEKRKQRDTFKDLGGDKKRDFELDL